MVQRHDRLEEPGCAGGRLGVPDLGLHAAQRAVLARAMLALAERQRETRKLRGVAGPGAGAVGLHQLHRARRIARRLVGPAQGLGLPLGHGGIDAGGAPVGRGAQAADERVDAIAVALGVIQALERHHAQPLPQQGAVGLIGEGAAVAADRERLGLGEAHEHQDVVHGVDPARDDQVGVPQVQLVEGHGQGREGGGAGRVGDAVGAAQVEAVCDPAGHHVAQQAREAALLPGHVVRGDAPACLLHLGLGQARLAQRLGPHRALQPAHHAAVQLLGRGHAQDDGDAGAVQGRKLLARGVLQHALGHDERQELGGVGGGQDAGRHAETQDIEVDRRQEAAPAAVGLVGRGRIRVVVVLDQPVSGGHVADQIRAGQDVAPEPGSVQRAREEGAHADDGDGRARRSNRDGHGSLQVRRGGVDGSRRRRRARGRRSCAGGGPG